jgi:hypothetical protein
MAAAPINIYNDIVNNVIVLGLNNGGLVELNRRKLYQGSKLPIRYYPVQPTNSLTPPFFTLVPLAGLSLDICVGPRAGSESLLARNNAWTATSQGYFEGTLNLNTSELNTAIGSADTYSTFIEINLTDSGEERVTYQETIGLIPVVKGPGTAASLPTAAVEYLTAAQQRVEFVRWFNNPAGNTIELLSPDGTRYRLLGVNNDGTALDETA